MSFSGCRRERWTQMTVILSLTAVWWLHLICLVGNETELQKLVLLATGSWQYFSSILSSLLGQSLLLGSQEWQQCRLCPVQMPASPPRPMLRASQHNRSSKAMSYTWQNCLRQHYRGLLNPKSTQILISTSCLLSSSYPTYENIARGCQPSLAQYPPRIPSLFPLGCI